MEDIKRRFEFGNVTVKLQAVRRLLNGIQNRKTKEILNNTSIQPPELKIIWECCISADSCVAMGCCDILVYLVKHGEMDYKYALHGLLNISTSARTLCGIVKALGDLMFLEASLISNADGFYKCPYGIRHNPHPYVTLLCNRPDSWPVLHQRLLALFNETSGSDVLAFQSMRPFVMYVVLDPISKTPQLRHALFQMIAQKVEDVDSDIGEHIKHFAIEIFPALQVNSLNNLGDAVSFLQLLSARLKRSEKNETFAEILASQLLQLLPQLVSFGLDVSHTQHCLLRLKENFSKVLSSAENIPLLARLIVMVPRQNIIQLLKLVEMVMLKWRFASVLCVMFVSPLLCVVSNSVLAPTTCKSTSTAAVELLKQIDQILARPHAERTKECFERSDVWRFINPETCNDAEISELTIIIQDNPPFVEDWLDSLEMHLSKAVSICAQIKQLVVALLIATRSEHVFNRCLRILPELSRLDPPEGFNFLSVLLYKLKKETTTEVHKLEILKTLPLLATSKINVGPILKVIQLISAQASMRPLSIHLLTSLWRQQERCYPHLLKLILDDDSDVVKQSNWFELMIAKALAVREICQLKPNQLGGDLLAPLSEILNECSDDVGSLPAAIAMDGLYALIKAEVVYLKTAWTVLAVKLSHDSRPIIVSKICNLFSLARQDDILDDESDEQEAFRDHILTYLWNLTESSDKLVSAAAFRALSNFKPDSFKIFHLPIKIQDFVNQSCKAQPITEDESNNEQDTKCVPATVYTHLLPCLENVDQEAFQEFLSCLVKEEVQDLPRGFNAKSLSSSSGASGREKAVAGIPSVIYERFEAARNPVLRSSFAAALLFCYDPPVKVGRDGRPRKHYIISHGHTYEHMLTTLVQEVPVKISDWHQCSLLTHAWIAFMDRLFSSRLEGYLNELDTQLQHGQNVSAEQIKQKKICGWMWIRDRIVDILKTASKGHPMAQFNSLLALSALAVVVNRHASLRDPEDDFDGEDSPHSGISHWNLVVIESLIQVLDPAYKSRSHILPWGQSVAGSYGVLLRSSACIGLSLVAPLFVSTGPDLICHVISIMKSLLPVRSIDSDDVPPALQFCNSLGLGMLLGRLQDEHFDDVSGTKGMVTMCQAIDALDAVCADVSLKNRTGCFIGLAFALNALCSSGKMDHKVHVTAAIDRLLSQINNTFTDETVYEALCFTVSMVASTAYDANILDAVESGKIAEILFQAHQKSKHSSGISFSLGHMCYSMHRIGHAQAEGIRDALFSTWIKSFTDENSDIVEKLVSVKGLSALVGSERILAPTSIISMGTSGQMNVAELVKTTTTVLTSASDQELQSDVAWMLGRLYLSMSSANESRSSVPSNYAYLPETSLLRVLVDYLTTAGKCGPEKICNKELTCVMNALLRGGQQGPLPPCNWAGIISPIMRMSFDEECKLVAIQLAVSQCASSATAAMFLSSWMMSPLFDTLQKTSQLFIYRSMSEIMKSTSRERFKSYLEQTCAASFERWNDAGLGVLFGLKEALRVKKPPQHAVALLHEMLVNVYKRLPFPVNPEVYDIFCECLAEVPDEIVDSITDEDFTDVESALRGCYVRCRLVANGKQPIALLNRLFDHALNTPACDHEEVLRCVSQCFADMCFVKEMEFTGPLVRLHWLMEYLGHSRRTLERHFGEKTFSQNDTNKIIVFALGVFAAAVINWSFCQSPIAVHVTNKNPKTTLQRIRLNAKQLLELLPIGLETLMDREPWRQINLQIIDWLIAVQSNVNDSDLRKKIHGCALATRHCDEFQKLTTWSRVFANFVF